MQKNIGYIYPSYTMGSLFILFSIFYNFHEIVQLLNVCTWLGVILEKGVL